ncbi:glycoside hydrolase family 5 protein [Actinomycetospora lutea]|uniref:glycoside hydrolase family 5 protein n=1 Tax=Actinomycetospora lutea TaxID=663604 RepID=UPI002365ECE1|nr:glycoside hydrolase family 5 protein [Actinomycetospora lutea]MDD7942006.1 glycoside hydrolase family 5 protein [Actinomycetospora lutea]
MRTRLRMLLAPALVVLVAVSCSAATPPGDTAPVPLSAGGPGTPVVTVAGNRLVDGRGEPVALRGVNRSGTQYACTYGPDTFDGPVDQPAIDAIRSWGVTAVRVSLNEQCWLGLNGLPVGRRAEEHRRDVVDLVDRLTAQGLVVIVDLHWNAPGSTRALGQQPMADRDHAPAFWRSVAATFAANRAVLFDLYNEPYPDRNTASDTAWRCVRDGGTCPGVDFATAGMQELVDAVRSTGAVNPILVAGPQWAGSVDRWLEYRPDDPAQQLVASIHIYGPAPDETACPTQACWDATIAPLALQVPVVIGEMGNMDCTSSVIEPLAAWADGRGIGYLAWGWVTSDCAEEPALISDYGGTPTPYGAGLRDHLRRD